MSYAYIVNDNTITGIDDINQSTISGVIHGQSQAVNVDLFMPYF